MKQHYIMVPRPRRRILCSLFAIILIICTLSAQRLRPLSVSAIEKDLLLLDIDTSASQDFLQQSLAVAKNKVQERADDSTWKKSVDKGSLLTCLFDAPDEATARAINKDRPVASTFTSYDDFMASGYQAFSDGGKPGFENELDSVYEDLNIDKDNNVEVDYMHNCNTGQVVLNSLGNIVLVSSA